MSATYFFGIRLATVGPVWGARAIDDNGDLDLVWDRQQADGGEPDERKALIAWLNGYALERLKREVIDLYDEPPHNALTFADGGYVVHVRRRRLLLHRRLPRAALPGGRGLMARPPNYHLDRLEEKIQILRRTRNLDRATQDELADLAAELIYLRRSLEDLRRDAVNIITERLKQ
jgi:hypothetical protein